MPQKSSKRKLRQKNAKKSVTLKWPWDLDARLGHYVVDRSYKEHRNVERTEVAEKAVDEFLRKEGY